MNLAIVVPCYNEEAVLPNTIKSLVLVLQKLQCAQKIDEGLLYWLTMVVMMIHGIL